MVTPVAITKQFNGDAAAVDFVNAAALDTQLGNLATTVNAEIFERQRTVKDGAGLVDQVVRYRSLHPEVIASLSGVVFLQAAAAATTAQITLSGLQVIDGYTTISGDRILVNNQSDQTQNGIYLALAGAWTRTTDASGALTTTSVVSIINGASYSGSMWRLSANATLGSSINSWILLQGGTPILPVNRGGTGANTAANARANLGLGSIALLNSIAQANITDGAVNQLKTANDVQYQVDTIALLKAEAANSHKTIFVRGYYASGDGGGGTFIWNASDATADNGGTVIIPNSAPAMGRWSRVIGGETRVSVRWFGAVGDGVADDAPAIIASLVYARTLGKPGLLNQVGGHININKGRYLIKQTIPVVEGDIITGDASGLDSAPIATASSGANIVVSTTLAGGGTWNNSVVFTVTSGGPFNVHNIGFNGTQTVTNSTWIKSGDGSTNIGLTQGKFFNVRVVGFTNAVQAYKFFDVDFSECGFESNEVDFNILGTGSFDDFSAVRFSCCTFFAPGTAHFQCSAGATPKRVSFSSCEFYQTVAGAGKIGFLIYDAAISGWQFSACTVVLSASNYFLRVIDATATVDGISFNGCDVSGGNLIGIPAIPVAGAMKAIRITGSRLRDSLVSVDSCTNGFKAVGCDFEGASTLTVTAGQNTVVVANDFSLCTGSVFVPGGVHAGLVVTANNFPAAYTTLGINSTSTRVVTGLNVGVPDFASGSAVYDPPSLVDGAGATTTVTASGCALGDYTSVSFSLDLQGITVSSYVSSANTVSVRFQNESGGTLDLASGTLRVTTRKP